MRFQPLERKTDERAEVADPALLAGLLAAGIAPHTCSPIRLVPGSVPAAA